MDMYSSQNMKLLITILFISVSITFAQDFDPPEVLCYIEGAPAGSTNFGNRFCWVGDQNGDGYDDLLASHDTYNPAYGELVNAVNRVELFYGGEEMDDEPDEFFTIDGNYYGIGNSLMGLGYLMPDRGFFFNIEAYFYNPNIRPIELIEKIYEGGEELDDDPEFSLNRVYGEHIDQSRHPHRTRPTDLNGDGYHDLITIRHDDDLAFLQFYWGGGDFDTIPDWEVMIHPSHNRYSGGYDVNNDGYDDLMLVYNLFLGGSPPDTTPVFSMAADVFFEDEELILDGGFSLLPDVNGDGFDDFGVYFYNPNRYTDGYLLFFGGEEPDCEPDVVLESNHIPDLGEGDIGGGDFNGDGYGDIVTGQKDASYNSGELHLYFGRPELPEQWDADIALNGEELFGRSYRHLGQYVGATGDYNGDGVDDFIVRSSSSDRGFTPSLIIFAGSRDWAVNSVEDELPEDFDLSLDAYPNPFNDQTKLSFQQPFTGSTNIRLFDTNGRLVKTVMSERVNRGSHSVMIDGSSLTGGVYFVNASFELGVQRMIETIKVVYLP